MLEITPLPDDDPLPMKQDPDPDPDPEETFEYPNLEVHAGENGSTT